MTEEGGAMKILIKNGRIVDPASGRDEVGDVAIAAGRIVALGRFQQLLQLRWGEELGLLVRRWQRLQRVRDVVAREARHEAVRAPVAHHRLYSPQFEVGAVW